MNLGYYIFYISIMPCIVLVITEGQATESSHFCFNSTFEGFRLNTAVWLKKRVSEWIECIMECVKEPCCRSINYKSTSYHEPNCEMLHDVVYNTSEKALEKNSSYDYVYLVNPEKDYNPSCLKVVKKSCASFYQSGEKSNGVYTVDPDGSGIFPVWCDMQHGGGWTVFQRRQDGSVDFNRAWSDYKIGFGNLGGEFWLGLDKLHRLTKSNEMDLRVNLTTVDGKEGYAQYKAFSVASESDDYEIKVGDYSGNLGDSLSDQNGMKFTTEDKDNDSKNNENCAVKRKGGWWFKDCGKTNLNGHYMKKLKWADWNNNERKNEKAEMKIRPTQL